jgi:hypothetical protein
LLKHNFPKMRFISKLLSCAVIALSLFSCERNLEDDNTPAIQAVRNGEFFKATQMSAVNNADGSVSIIGINQLERLEIQIESGAAGTYPLGFGSENTALYTFNSANEFSTNTGNGTGRVVISSNSPMGTISGTFDFVSYLPNDADSLYMRRGMVFQVPFNGDLGTGGGTATNMLTATVDGTLFTPAAVLPLTTGGQITVLAAAQTVQISLNFPETITSGNYPFGAGNVNAAYINNGAQSPAISGSLVVTAANQTANTVNATFSFTTGPPNNFSVTNGSFSITY